MFSVGPAFKGIKMIPPASHFLYHSSSTRDGKDFSPIIGFFIHAAPSEVLNAFTLFPLFLLYFVLCSIRSALCHLLLS
nr:protein aar2 like [Quercus suber]